MNFCPSCSTPIRKNATIDGKLYGLPYIWGTEGLIYNSKRTKISDYLDLCKPELRGRTTVRLKRPTLMAFALASGKNPFALYDKHTRPTRRSWSKSARRSAPAR